jgi:eukaryotic-like serine/threonine-protein kinase
VTSPVLAMPKRLGHYQVGAKIGGGGMATIYLGRRLRDEGGGEELVALKVIRDEYAHDEQFSSMFDDEAKILSRLSHPNVIHTLEYGASGSHRFIAMELLSGRTYSVLWETLVGLGERMPLRLGAWLCARVADGLHSAHELVDDSGTPLSVIHRDVNPGNVFLTYGGEVKLIDFGLAKARVRMSKSAEGIVKGKIPYLAPEQAAGGAIDRRIDVYALGTTLWETVTMKRLFKRDTDLETLKAIREAHVPDVRDMFEGFPDTLWEILQRALARHRDERYPTAAALSRDLDAFVGDTAAMNEELSALLHRVFPGQEVQHDAWLRDATSVRLQHSTIPPPTPLPIASSSLLEDDDSDPALSTRGPGAGSSTASEIANGDDRAAASEGALPATRTSSSTMATAGAAKRPSKKSKKARAKARARAQRESTGRASASGQRAAKARRAQADARDVPTAKSRRREGDAARRERDERRREGARRGPPPPETRRMWVSAAIVVAVLVAIALLAAAR